jgi:uncharacterized protein YutE (UPF0331/DUF86 family)
MAWPLIEQKLESLRRCLRRIEEKCPKDVDALVKDYDAQDILTLNLTRSIQLCVDIGAHLISETEWPPPDTMGQVFDILMEAGIIDAELAGRMKKVVGFRNLAIHNYDAMNWAIVHAIAQYRLTDFEDFAKAVVMASRQGI